MVSHPEIKPFEPRSEIRLGVAVKELGGVTNKILAEFNRE